MGRESINFSRNIIRIKSYRLQFRRRLGKWRTWWSHRIAELKAFSTRTLSRWSHEAAESVPKCATDFTDLLTTAETRGWNRPIQKGGSARAYGLVDLYTKSFGSSWRTEYVRVYKHAPPIVHTYCTDRKPGVRSRTGTLRHGNHPVILLIQMSPTGYIH